MTLNNNQGLRQENTLEEVRVCFDKMERMEGRFRLIVVATRLKKIVLYFQQPIYVYRDKVNLIFF
jgi:hypothetical protein